MCVFYSSIILDTMKSNHCFAECKVPVTPAFGQMEITNTNSTVLYGCDIGYTLTGPSKRQCLEDGSGWEEADPVCSKLTEVTFCSMRRYSIATMSTKKNKKKKKEKKNKSAFSITID